MIGHFKHAKTGGIYVLESVALDEATLDAVCIYRSVRDGRVWVRPAHEFFGEILALSGYDGDGDERRFVPVREPEEEKT